jgi:hypothetical protein
MTMPQLPAPEPGDAEPNRQHENAQQQAGDEPRAHSQSRTKSRHVASEEDCLAALSQIPAMLALGMLTPTKANAMRAVYSSILQHYRQTQARTDGTGGTNDGLAAILADHPEYASLLEPMLSDEQIARILAQAKEHRNGAA